MYPVPLKFAAIFAILKMCQSAFSATFSGVLSGVSQKEEKKKKITGKMAGGY